MSGNHGSNPTTGAAPKPPILLVEDDPSVRRAISSTLSSLYEVVAVESAIAAVGTLADRQFPVVISDIHMPDMTGIEFLRALRRAHVNTQVLLLTGEPSFETARDAVNLGAFCYMTKPVSADDLRDAVSRAMKASPPSGAFQHEPEPPKDKDNELRERLERAFETLWMAFQPIVSLRSKSLLGYEALLRTEEKSLGRPPDLLAAAEQLGRLGELGRRIRKYVGGVVSKSPADLKFFVNLAASDLDETDLLSEDSALRPHASRIILELTERASLDGIKSLASRVAELRAAGYSLAVDDLGAGYAGLTSLARLEPEVVKIDMSLVRDVEKSATKQQLIRSVVQMCVDLRMRIVAEGVETPAERDQLDMLGCDLLQGYLFGKPQRELMPPTF